MQTKTPTALWREGGDIVRSGGRRITPINANFQSAERVQVPARAIPSVYASQLREAAQRLDCVGGFEGYAAKSRRYADLIERGLFWQRATR